MERLAGKLLVGDDLSGIPDLPQYGLAVLIQSGRGAGDFAAA